MAVPYQKKRQFPKHETDFIISFMKELNKRKSGLLWFFKTHGEPMQVRGIPDILGCYCGLFLGFEFKIMRNSQVKPSPYQEYNLDLINKTGGVAITIWWDERNASVGINSKRFDNQELAIDFLVELLDGYTKMTYLQLRNFKNSL